jgi:hypothetical protein
VARWWWDGDAGDRPETPPRGLQGRHRRKRLRPVGRRHVNGPRWRDRGADWSTAGVVARLLVVFVLGLVLGALLQLAAVAPSACPPAPSPVPITGNVGGRG